MKYPKVKTRRDNTINLAKSMHYNASAYIHSHGLNYQKLTIRPDGLIELYDAG